MAKPEEAAGRQTSSAGEDASLTGPGHEPPIPESRFRAGVGIRDWPVMAFIQATHPKQAAVMTLGVTLLAIAAGRPARESAIIALTVLTGNVILGLHNDLVDRQRDQAHGTEGKPIADGRLTVPNTWTAVILAGLLLVPLSITTGITAGWIYMGSVALAMLGNVLFRTTILSWWSWAASFALIPAYITYGGWGGQAVGNPPEVAMTILFALLGIGVHFLRSVWGLVADHEDGWTYLPLKLGMKLGATRLLMVTSLYLGAVAVGIAIAAGQVGLSA